MATRNGHGSSRVTPRMAAIVRALAEHGDSVVAARALGTTRENVTTVTRLVERKLGATLFTRARGAQRSDTWAVVDGPAWSRLEEK